MKEFINSLWGKKAGKAAIGILAALFIIGGGVTLYERHEAKLAAQTLTLNGNVDLREVSLAFKNSDRIAEILVEEGDAVKKDQVLARLDSDALQYKVKIAEAQVAAQQAVVDKLHNGTRRQELDQAVAKAQETAANRDFLQREYERKQAAYDASQGRSISDESLDDVKSKLDAATARANEAQANYELALAGPRKEDIASGEAKLESLTQELKELQYTLGQYELKAPQDGVIRSRLLEVGDMASPQKPVFLISLNTKKWVRVYVKESDLGKLHEGSQASVYIDSFPNHAIQGQVGYISGTAEFTPKNVETKDLRSALLYEVRVYVEDPDNLLRMGMPATVKIKL